jgi:hypothetical protein
MNSFIGVLGRLFSADGFVPRRAFGLWPDWLAWEHVAGNALVCRPMTFLFAHDRLDKESA